MSKKPAQSKGGAGKAPARALKAIEQSLAVLGTQGVADSGSDLRGDETPFVSLLAQCEAMLGAQPVLPATVSVLRALPGVPALAPRWWAQRFGGLVVRQLTDSDASDPGFAAWLEATRDTANAVLFTAPLDVALPDAVGQDQDAAVCVVYHPYVAFHTYNRDVSLTLSAYCTQVLGTLDAVLGDSAGAKPLRLESLDDPAFELQRALALPDSLTEFVSPLDYGAPVSGPPPYFEGGEAYRALCTRLGYDPDHLPPASARVQAPAGGASYVHAAASGQDPAVASPALISDFLARAAQVRHALDPAAPPFDATAIVLVMDTCLAAGDDGFLDLFDLAMDQLGDVDAATACIAASTHFFALGERISALNFLGNALLFAPRDVAWLRILIAAAYADMNETKSALLALVSDALAPGVLDEATRSKLGGMVSNTILAGATDHGHILLMDYLDKVPPLVTDRRRVLIEIGTTRELVLGQGSTQKLAEMCRAYGLHFITVDMDPRNTRGAARMFAREGYDFEAVTAKGEDYLAAYEGPIDYVFLDAYDFDHGNHSEIRQDRYEKFLGSRIEEEQCHQMHLECAYSLVKKMPADGLICFDDTWTDAQGAWTAKGKTAMPYLLEQDFELIEARFKAALLRPVVVSD